METMSTVFKFVFESAGGGETPPENVSAQTGDWLSILLITLFVVAAIASLFFIFIKSKNSNPLQMSGKHSIAKTTAKPTTLIAGLIAALATVGAVISFINMPAINAFANGNAEGVDYKPQITATVHESDQSVTFETNFFTNKSKQKLTSTTWAFMCYNIK